MKTRHSLLFIGLSILSALSACGTAPLKTAMVVTTQSPAHELSIGLAPTTEKGFYGVLEENNARWHLNRLSMQKQTELKAGEEQIFVNSAFTYIAPVFTTVRYTHINKKTGKPFGYSCNSGYAQGIDPASSVCNSKLLKLVSFDGVNGTAEFIAGSIGVVATLGAFALAVKEPDPEVLHKLLADTDFIAKATAYCADNPLCD